MRRYLCCVAVIALGSATLPAQTDGVEVLRNIEFGKGSGRALKLHVVRVKDAAGPRPCVVWIHGGGWEGGSRDSGITPLTHLAKAGYVGVSIEYRLSREAVYPAQIEDCKCAIRFLRAKAKDYGIDPMRIGVWGPSAGGHLSALLGTTGGIDELEGKGGWPEQSSKVQAVCDCCGPADLIVWNADYPKAFAKGALYNLLGGPYEKKRDLARLASPAVFASADDPPFLIMHGDQDKLVPLKQSERLHAALRGVGAQSTLSVIKGGSHNFLNPQNGQEVLKFFDQHLNKK